MVVVVSKLISQKRNQKNVSQDQDLDLVGKVWIGRGVEVEAGVIGVGAILKPQIGLRNQKIRVAERKIVKVESQRRTRNPGIDHLHLRDYLTNFNFIVVMPVILICYFYA